MPPSTVLLPSFAEFLESRPFRAAEQDLRPFSEGRAVLTNLLHHAEETVVPATNDLVIVAFVDADCDIHHDAGKGWSHYRAIPARVILNPPHTDVAFRAEGPRHLIILSLPMQHIGCWVNEEASFIDDQLRPLHLVALHDRLITDLLLRMWSETSCQTSASELFVDSALRSVMALLLRHAGHPPSSDSAQPDQRRLRRVVDFMMVNLGRELSVSELANIACLSPHHFSRTFRNAMGLAPHAFLLRQRSLRAADLLTTSCLPLSTIADRCGFASQSHMTTVFRRHFGLTPGEHRRRCRR